MKFKFIKEYAKKYKINAKNDFELLEHLSYKKLNELNLPEEQYKIYKNRIEKELNFFKDTDMPSYILTWLDILNHTKGLFLVRYPSSSLILFLLGISKVDPIKWDLIFELDFKKSKNIFVEFSSNAKKSAIDYMKKIYEKIEFIEAMVDKYIAIDNEEFLYVPYNSLRALDLIESVTQKVGIDINNINFEDKKVYEFISKGLTGGIFLLDKGIYEFYDEEELSENAFNSSKEEEILNARKYIKKLKPASLDELIAFHALNRTSTIENGILDEYINNKIYGYENNYFSSTYGVLVYQEQVIKILTNLANFSIDEALSIYKAIAKRKINLVEKYEQEFISRINNEDAKKLFSLLRKSPYTFSKSLALVWAILTYETAYLKYYYLEEFFEVLLKIEKDEFDKCRYLAEAKKLGVK